MSPNENIRGHRRYSDWDSRRDNRNGRLERSAQYVRSRFEDPTRNERRTRQETLESRLGDSRREFRDMRRTAEHRLKRFTQHAGSDLEDTTNDRRTSQNILESRLGDSQREFGDMRRTAEHRLGRSVQHADLEYATRIERTARQRTIVSRLGDSRREFRDVRRAAEHRLGRSVQHAENEQEDSRAKDESRTRQEMLERRSANSERRLDHSSRDARIRFENVRTRDGHRTRPDTVESQTTSSRWNELEREIRYKTNANDANHQARRAANYQAIGNSFVSLQETERGPRNHAIPIRRAAVRVNGFTTLDSIIGRSTVDARKRTTSRSSTERLTPNLSRDRTSESRMRFHSTDDRRGKLISDSIFYGDDMRDYRSHMRATRDHRGLEDFRATSKPLFDEVDLEDRAIHLRRDDRQSGLQHRDQRMTEREANVQNRRFSTDSTRNEMLAKGSRLHESRRRVTEHAKANNQIRESRRDNVIDESVNYDDPVNRRQRRNAGSRDDYHFVSAKAVVRASDAVIHNRREAAGAEEIAHNLRTDRVREPEFSRKHGHHRTVDVRRVDNRKSKPSYDANRIRTNSRENLLRDSNIREYISVRRGSNVRRDRAEPWPSRRQSDRLMDDRLLDLGQQFEKMNREDLVHSSLPQSLAREERLTQRTGQEKRNRDNRVRSNAEVEIVGARMEDARTQVQDASRHSERTARMVMEQRTRLETTIRTSTNSRIFEQRDTGSRGHGASDETGRYDRVERTGKSQDVRELRTGEATRDQSMVSRTRELDFGEPRVARGTIRMERLEDHRRNRNSVERDARVRMKSDEEERRRDARQVERFARPNGGMLVGKTDHRREIELLSNAGAWIDGRRSHMTATDMSLSGETDLGSSKRGDRSHPCPSKEALALGNVLGESYQKESSETTAAVTDALKEAITLSGRRDRYNPKFHKLPFMNEPDSPLFTTDKLPKWEQLISARTSDYDLQPHPHSVPQKQNLHWINNIITRATDPNSWFQTALAVSMVAWTTWLPNKKISVA
ncbi:uncharacterized protein ISCGN_011152 [Ixodes scapularis]